MGAKAVEQAAAETKEEKKKKDAAKSDPAAQAQLLKDVAAFAAELGFASGGLAPAADDAAFADFAPEAAKKQFGEGKKGKQEQKAKAPATDDLKKSGKAATDDDAQQYQKGKQGSKAAGPQERKQQQQQKKEQPEQQQEQPAEQPKLPARDWNFGVGPRPGEKQGKSLLGKDEPTIWYEAAAALPPLPATSAVVSDEVVEQLRAQCEKMLENEAAAFEREMGRRNPADFRWLQQVKRSGTTADKVAAYTLQVQESAVGSLKSLDSLLSWVQKRKGGKEVVRQALEALKELFLKVLLPDNRHLKHFDQQPLAALPEGKEGARYLLWWYLEDQVKVRYNMFIAALEETSRESLEFLKDKALKTIYDLLASKPEGEARLLAALVNKLGDPSRKLASKAAYLLSQLLGEHPVMKPVVVREVERFIFRPGLQDRARYYAVIFLNQLPLSHKETEGGSALARKLVDVYFTLFRLVVEGNMGKAAEARKAQEERYKKLKAAYLRAKRKLEQDKAEARAAGKRRGIHGHKAAEGMKDKKRTRPLKKPVKPSLAVPEEMDARLLSALITGIRRAFPYVDQNEVDGLVEGNLQRLYRIVHTAPFSVAVQALMLMWQIMSEKATTTNDRFYRALYSVMASDSVTNSTKGPMFLSLLFKAMKADVSSKRCTAFAKRLLQSACLGPAPYACGALLLLSEVLKAQPALWAGILQPEDLPAAMAAAAAVEVSKGGVAGIAIKASKAQAAAAAKGLDDDGEEVFVDVDAPSDASDEEEQGEGRQHSRKEAGSNDRNGLVPGGGKSHAHADQQQRQQDAERVASGAAASTSASGYGWPKSGYYDMHKREPQFAHAERACWWELVALASHAHPSVASFSRTLLSGQCIVYAGDPLRDLALTSFLDKFIEKKPKAHSRGSSLMQPIGPDTGAAAARAVASDAFAALAESQVQPDEVFFHRFYTLQSVKTKREVAKAAKAAKKAREEERDEMDNAEGLGSDEEGDVDEFLEKEEGGVDDKLGDPDVGYDYDSLVEAMQEDRLGKSDDDEEEEGASEEEGQDGSEGGSEAAEEGEEGSGDDEDEEEEGDAEVESLSGEEEGEEGGVPDVDDLEDSGDDEEQEWVMASPGQLEEQQQQQQSQQKGKKGKKAAPAPAQGSGDDVGDDELDALGLDGVLSLPSPTPSSSFDLGGSSDDGEEVQGARRRGTKRSAEAAPAGGAKGSKGSQDSKKARLMQENTFEGMSSSDDDEEEEQQPTGKRKGGAAAAKEEKKGKKRRKEEEEEEEDVDNDSDIDGMFLGSDEELGGEDDDDDGSDDETGPQEDGGDEDGGEEEEGGQAASESGQGKKKKQKSKAPLFASADDYEDVIAEFERQQAAMAAGTGPGSTSNRDSGKGKQGRGGSEGGTVGKQQEGLRQQQHQRQGQGRGQRGRGGERGGGSGRGGGGGRGGRGRGGDGGAGGRGGGGRGGQQGRGRGRGRGRG